MTIFDHIPKIKDCILELLVGESLGEGASRSVYSLEERPDIVLKVERTGHTFHNPTEWMVWHEVKDWPIADWFAPCIEIDSWGTALLQRRTEPFENERAFREALRRTRGGLLPTVFADTHYHNFGMLNGQVTCHDYGYHKMYHGGARAMCEELGYIKYDPPEANVETHRVDNGDQYALDL